MMNSSRSAQLQSLQALTEMQEFLDFISNEGSQPINNNHSQCTGFLNLQFQSISWKLHMTITPFVSGKLEYFTANCNYFPGNFLTTSSTTSLLKRWSSREPDSKLHSVDIWDDVMTNRYIIVTPTIKDKGPVLPGRNIIVLWKMWT